MWEYRRPLPPVTSLRNGLGQRKRSIALYGDQVYFVTWDNIVVSLAARTGELVWQTDRGGDLYISNSSGPIVANGVVIAGSTCQYSGNGCYVTGHDARTGKELWRNEMIPRPGQPGDETWAGSPFESRWMTGVWGQLTYDPDLDLVYYGSSGVGPASEAQRNMPGATMAGTNTRFAVRPKTGEVVWKHQVLPPDTGHPAALEGRTGPGLVPWLARTGNHFVPPQLAAGLGVMPGDIAAIPGILARAAGDHHTVDHNGAA